MIIKPDRYNTKMGIVCTKRISKALELPFIKFSAHHPDYTHNSDGMSSKIHLNEYKMDCAFSQNEWLWILEFNKCIFSEILYPNLGHWIYQMNEIQSYEMRNYLIVPLGENNGDFDWCLMEEIVKYFYSKHRESYRLKQLLLDLGLMNQNRETQKLEQMIFVENGRYFVPLPESKQKILPIIKRIIDEFDEEKFALLNDDDQKDDENDENDEIIDKIEDYLHCANKKLQIISMRLDIIGNFIENVTESVSKIYQKENKWIHKPMIDAINVDQNGLFKAPFHANFFYGLLRIPFILYQIERILGILQFIQSQQYLNKPIGHRSSHSTKHSFLMKMPLLTLSKIVFQQRISIPHRELFKNVGQQLLTLIYSTTSTLSMLSDENDNKLQTNMVDITQKCMTNSVKRFRKTLESNQILHYFAPSQFRNSSWIPPRFHNISSSDATSLIDAHYEHIAESQIGQNVNAYISKLLYPTSNGAAESDELIFSMMTDFFASVWYYNYAKENSLDVKQLFLDCNEIINWMQIDEIFNLPTSSVQKVVNDLDKCSKSMNVSNDYAFLNFYHRLTDKQYTKRSLVKTLHPPNGQSCEEKELEEVGAQSIELNDSMSIKWCKEELQSLNPSLQALIYKFVNHIEYEFEYPFICITVIDPLCVHRKQSTEEHNFSFELLYDLGNIVLNTLITITVSINSYQQRHKSKIQGMDRLMFYKKCLMSNKYLCHQCRVHSLQRHILTDKENQNLLSELLGAFMFSIIGAIYLDSNLISSNEVVSNEDGLQAESVWDFVERFLPETVFQQDIGHILHLFSITKGNVHRQAKQRILTEPHDEQKQHMQKNDALFHKQYPQNQRRTNHEHRKLNDLQIRHKHKNGYTLPTVSELSEHSKQLKTPRIGIKNGIYPQRKGRNSFKTDLQKKEDAGKMT